VTEHSSHNSEVNVRRNHVKIMANQS